MFISVSFDGVLRKVANTDQIQVPFQEGNRVDDILEYIKDHYPDLPVKKETHLAIVNSRITSFNQILNNDDEVSFTPIIGGG